MAVNSFTPYAARVTFCVRARFLHTESFRLTIVYAVIFALSVAVLGTVVLAITNATLRDQIVQFAQADIAAMRDGYEHEGVREAREVTLQHMAAKGAADFLLLQHGDHLVAGNLPMMSPVEGVQEIADPNATGHTILGVGELLAPHLYAFAGSDLSYVQAVRVRILNVLLWLFLAALVPAGLGGVLVSRNFLARTDAIASTCRAIMAGNLKNRIPVRGNQDELDLLAVTINQMLGRIDALMENLHQVTNDIAHDLRTPLTHLRNGLEQALSNAQTPEEHAAALKSGIAAADDILLLFRALLRLAQVEGGARRGDFISTDLTTLLGKVREVYSAVAEDTEHTLIVEAAPPCLVLGDKELLFQLLANLVENAIVHTPVGTRIIVSLEVGAETVEIHVRDNGPGVPSAEYAKLFQRFYRREASRSTPGHGLGLAVVSAVSELHGGTVRIEPVPEGHHGMDVHVTLPRLPDAVA